MTSDRELAERLADRDESALAALYDRMGARAYGLALSILGDGGEAEEAVSDGFLQVWENAAEFSSERGGLDAWLLTVVRSRALDRLRTRKRRSRLADAAERDVASFTLGTTRSDPEARHLARVTLEGRVAEAVAGLSGEKRRVIELAYLGGLTHREISEELGVPLGTVKTRLRTGMIELRSTLDAGTAARKEARR